MIVLQASFNVFTAALPAARSVRRRLGKRATPRECHRQQRKQLAWALQLRAPPSKESQAIEAVRARGEARCGVKQRALVGGRKTRSGKMTTAGR